ncbi:MAG TPA: hypothetical protein P5016_07170, partial [Verrucomicrobiales bacterium]|nr:hypothetical protein [Verrucomicrobiales bacterium]
LGASLVQRQVLILESSMPSALLSVTLSARYGCDAVLASRLVLATAAMSLVTLPLIFSILM